MRLYNDERQPSVLSFFGNCMLMCRGMRNFKNKEKFATVEIMAEVKRCKYLTNQKCSVLQAPPPKFGKILE